jgi:hypothetical protein
MFGKKKKAWNEIFFWPQNVLFDTILKKRGRPKNVVSTILTNGPLVHISLPMAKPIQRLLQHTNLANLFRHTPQRGSTT